MDELYGVGKDGHGPFRESHQTRGAENQDRGGLNTFYKKKIDDIFISKVDARSSGAPSASARRARLRITACCGARFHSRRAADPSAVPAGVLPGPTVSRRAGASRMLILR
jgi:hypothetical protein